MTSADVAHVIEQFPQDREYLQYLAGMWNTVEAAQQGDKVEMCKAAIKRRVAWLPETDEA